MVHSPSFENERITSGCCIVGDGMRSVSILFAACCLTLSGSGWAADTTSPDIILITLDTVRADALGSYGAPTRTPNLDRLAASGRRYEEAISPAPLTLPAHASLITGLLPISTGVRENGVSALPPGVPTLATELRSRGYATGAFVSSRVLDHRFGLARGFDRYDDDILAEQMGEDGYAERNAQQVTDAALSWLGNRPSAKPLFLWVHYFDAHAPYEPPIASGPSDLHRYRAEIEFVDSQLGRLLTAVGTRSRERVVAAVGDHGESLGEHGERTHGVFLYRSTLRVPLIVSGVNIEPGQTVFFPVSTVGVAATLMQAAGQSKVPAFGGPLAVQASGLSTTALYSETFLPRSAYGWASLDSIRSGRWHAVFAPRPELYDVTTDAAEKKNIIEVNRREFFRLKKLRDELTQRVPRVKPSAAAVDAELSAALRSLGYAQGSSPVSGPAIDPKDGIVWLGELEQARELAAGGRSDAALKTLEKLVTSNPTNIVFLTELASQQLRAREPDKAITTYRRAASLNPRVEFLHLNLADALRISGQLAAARAEYRIALEIDPTYAAAAIRLAEMDLAAGDRKGARSTLLRAVEAGMKSASVLTRLARVELDLGLLSEADKHASDATSLAAGWAAGWVVRGMIAERRGQSVNAIAHYERALRINPSSSEATLALGKLLLGTGKQLRGRELLQRTIAINPQSSEAAAARKLLGQ